MIAAAIAVLEQAVHLGVTLRGDRGRIVARPKEAVTSVFAAEVAACRGDLLKLLAAGVAPPKTACWNCRGTKFFARPERVAWICSRCHPPADATSMVWHEVSVVAAGSIEKSTSASGGSGA